MNAPTLNPYTLEGRNLAAAARDAGGKRLEDGNWKIATYTATGKRLFWSATYNASQEARAKFGKVNLKGKPENLLYIPRPDTRAAIAQADGMAYLFSGVPDTLAALASGLGNVLAIFSDTHIPHDLATQAAALGITKLVFFPDNDESGKRAAQCLYDLLASSPCDFEVRRVPSTVKDVCALWEQVSLLGESAPVLFETVLNSAQVMPMQPIPKQHKTTLERIPKSAPDADYTAHVLAAIEASQDKPLRWRAKSGYDLASITNPFEHGKKPNCYVKRFANGWLSFGDFKRGETLNTHELGERFGIAHAQPTYDAPQAPRRDFYASLCTNAGGAKVAHLLARAAYLGVQFDGLTEYTVKGLQALCVEKQLPARFAFAHRDIGVLNTFFARFTVYSSFITYLHTNSAKKVGHRQEKHFTFSRLDALFTHFGVPCEGLEVLPYDALVSLKAFRLHVYQQNLEQLACEHDGFGYGVIAAASALGKPLNVSPSTVRNYDRALGVGRTSRNESIPMPDDCLLIADKSGLVAPNDAAKTFMEGLPKGAFIVWKERRAIVPKAPFRAVSAEKPVKQPYSEPQAHSRATPLHDVIALDENHLHDENGFDPIEQEGLLLGGQIVETTERGIKVTQLENRVPLNLAGMEGFGV